METKKKTPKESKPHESNSDCDPKDESKGNIPNKPKEGEKSCICTCDKECCKTHPNHSNNGKKSESSPWDASNITIWDRDFQTTGLTITSIESISEDIFLPNPRREKGLNYYKVNVKEEITEERNEKHNYFYVSAHLYNGECFSRSTDIKSVLESYTGYTTSFTFKRFFYDCAFTVDKRVRYYALAGLEESKEKKNHDVSKELLEVRRKELNEDIIEFSSRFSIGGESIQKHYSKDYKVLIQEIKLDKFDLAKETINLVIILLATEKVEHNSNELMNNDDVESAEVNRLISYLEKVNEAWNKYSKPISSTDNPLYIDYLDNFTPKKELAGKLLENWKRLKK